MNILQILTEYQEGFKNGLLATIQLCLIVWSIGITIGLILGILESIFQSYFSVLIKFCNFLLSSIPILVLLFWFHYPAQSILSININPFYTTVFVLGLVNTFAVAQITLTSIKDFPKNYLETALVTGLSKMQTIRHIQIPLIFRSIIPSILSTQVYIFQATLFASLISVDEVFRVAQRINSQIYRPVEIYSALALLFVLVCLPLNGLGIYLRNKFKNSSYV
jgi:ABC-type amino acid transport system permease subunit